MAKQSLQEKRDRLLRKLDYLCSNDSIDTEMIVLFAPVALVSLAITLLLFLLLAHMLVSVCEYDFVTALKISGCFCLMIAMLLGMLEREWAYKKATETIIERRKKVTAALDRINYHIRKGNDLEFVSLDPD